jgi:hypothetical protein
LNSGGFFAAASARNLRRAHFSSRDRTDGAFDGAVAELDTAVIKEAR